MARVVFRADAGVAIGSGHIMRCLALAAPFSDGGWNVAFAANEETFSSVAALREATIDRCVLPSDRALEAAALAKSFPGGADVLVVDHYQRDASFEQACRPWARRIIAIDDLADRPHDADVLVDGGATSAAIYDGLMPKEASVLAGSSFAVIHPSFRIARSEALARRDGRDVGRILVSFGQVDAPNATMMALNALSDADYDGDIDVVLGGAAPHLSDVRTAAGGRIRLHVDATNMPALMIAADMAIGAGGVSAWERCCLGLPSVLLQIADNQRGIISRISSAGGGMEVGSSPGQMSDALDTMLGDSERRKTMAMACAELVDGRAYERVFVAAVGAASAEGDHLIVLRLAETMDEDWLFELQTAPATRRFSNDPNPPSREGHGAWFRRTLSDTSRILMIAEMAKEPVGVLRLDRGSGSDRVSIAVHPQYHRLGIGSAMLALASRLAPGRALDAEVLPDNDASRALFEAAGYRGVSDRLFRRVPQ